MNKFLKRIFSMTSEQSGVPRFIPPNPAWVLIADRKEMRNAMLRGGHSLVDTLQAIEAIYPEKEIDEMTEKWRKKIKSIESSL